VRARLQSRLSSPAVAPARTSAANASSARTIGDDSGGDGKAWNHDESADTCHSGHVTAHVSHSPRTAGALARTSAANASGSAPGAPVATTRRSCGSSGGRASPRRSAPHAQLSSSASSGSGAGSTVAVAGSRMSACALVSTALRTGGGTRSLAGRERGEASAATTLAPAVEPSGASSVVCSGKTPLRAPLRASRA
jgi:hypothetical protein